MNISRFADAYTRKYGLHIVPLPPRSKRPTTPDWGDHLLSDPDSAVVFYSDHPEANLGIALGPSRICSLDVDDLDAMGMICADFGIDLQKLSAEYPTIQGASKGYRITFRVPDGVELDYHAMTWPARDGGSGKFTVFELRAACEGQQRQDVFPPSIHPDTGRPYVWLTRPNGKFPPPPAWLLTIWREWDKFKPQFQAICPWAPKPEPRKLQAPKPLQGDSVIDRYNASRSIEDALSSYGYKRVGARWLSPHSGTGLPGVNIFDDGRAWIHHASDPLCSDESGQPVNAFDLFCYYEHGGDASKAVKYAAEALGMRRTPAPAKTERIDPDTGEITPEPAEPSVPVEAYEADAYRAQFSEPLNVFTELPAPPLRADMLPDAIARYATDQAELIGVSVAMIAMPALVSCASVLHDGITIQPKRHETGWRESARLWCAVVCDPSGRKSPSINRAVKRLKKINKELCDENERKTGEYMMALDDYKDGAKKAKKSGESEPKKPDAPEKKRLIVEDVTIEALSEILKHNSRGVLCIQDELSGWFGSMDAYSGGKAANKDRAHWLESYNGGHRMVDRVMRGSLSIPNWSTSMIGGIQPDMIRRIAKNMGEDGLMQRFMIVIGGNAGDESDRPEDVAAKRAYSGLIDSLYALQPSEDPVLLSEDAHIVRERLNVFSRDLIAYSSLPGGLKSHLGKWSGLFARLLLLFHAIECAEAGVYPAMRSVSGALAERVERLMTDFLLPHAISYYTDVIGEATDMEHIRWIAGWILAVKLERVENRELTQAYRAWRGIDQWRRARIMLALEDYGWILPTTDPKPGRNMPGSWAVNPVAHDLYSGACEAEKAKRQAVRDRVESLRG